MNCLNFAHDPRVIARLLLAALLMLGMATHLEASAGGLRISDLDQYETRYYNIFSNLPPEEVEFYAEHMDLVFEEFDRLLGDFHTARRYRPQSIFLVQTRTDYLALMGSFGISAAHSGGMYFRTDSHRRSGLATYFNGRENTLRTLRHEAFHQFADYLFQRGLPRWLNEGMAEYFEQAVLVEHQGEPRLVVGLAPAAPIDAIQKLADAGHYLPLDELFHISAEAWRQHMRHGAPNQFQGAGSAQYVQSWSLIHFFLEAEDRRYRDAFRQFLHGIHRGRDQRTAFRDAFGADIAEAEQAWLAFLVDFQPDHLSLARAHLQQVATFVERDSVLAREGLEDVDRLRDRLDAFAGTFNIARILPLGMTLDPAAIEGRSVLDYRTDAGDWVAFEILEPDATEGEGEQFPSIVATQLVPQVRLTWGRDDAGDIQPHISFHVVED